MTQNLRLSPSGPVVGGIGPNFARRSDLKVATQIDMVLTDEPQEVDASSANPITNALRASLEGMLATSKFRIECEYDVSNTSSQTPATILTTLQVRTAPGEDWANIADFEHVAGCVGVGGANNLITRPIYTTHAPFEASGVTGFAGSLEARAVTETADGEEDTVVISGGPTAWIKITELFDG